MIHPSQRTAHFHYAIRNIVGAAERIERAGRAVTYLNIGDPQVFGFRPPDHIVDAVQRALHDSFTGYAHSAGLMEARIAVANYATHIGASTTPKDVLITSGASEAADLILSALVNQGDEVLLPSPGYPLYTAILNKLGALPRYYDLDDENGWQPSVANVRRLINQRTRALVLINPNNPTGSIIPDALITQLLEIAAEHNLLVISDEVYRELCFVPSPTSASILADRIKLPLITLESLSKTHMVPGWRVGWMRFTHAEQMTDLIAAITRLASGRLCSPTPTQYAVRPALEGDNGFVQGFISEIKSRRDAALAQINSIDGLSCVRPDAAFYMMVRVEDPLRREDEHFVLDLLQSTGLLVVHGSGFGADPKKCFFRLVYLADAETLATSFALIKEFLDSAKGKD
jgi:aspartate/methionine/tyrosine aminotransferase